MNGPAESIFMCGPDGRLVGILTEASQATSTGERAGAVFLNAGNAHRVGPNRIYVSLSRDLAGRGLPCCRFDLSGIGDSPARCDGLPFREFAPRETRQVLDDLEARLGLRRFILIGICAGADVAFDTASQDPRVAAVVLINGAFVDGGAFASAYHRAEGKTQRRYYVKRLFSPTAWLRLLSARSAFWEILADAVRKRLAAKPVIPGKIGLKPVACESREKWAALARRRVPVLLVFAEGSVFWDVFRAEVVSVLHGEYPADLYTVVLQKAADHTFTLLSSQEALAETVTSWLEAEFGKAAHVP